MANWEEGKNDVPLFTVLSTTELNVREGIGAKDDDASMASDDEKTELHKSLLVDATWEGDIDIDRLGVGAVRDENMLWDIVEDALINDTLDKEALDLVAVDENDTIDDDGSSHENDDDGAMNDSLEDTTDDDDRTAEVITSVDLTTVADGCGEAVEELDFVTVDENDTRDDDGSSHDNDDDGAMNDSLERTTDDDSTAEDRTCVDLTTVADGCGEAVEELDLVAVDETDTIDDDGSSHENDDDGAMNDSLERTTDDDDRTAEVSTSVDLTTVADGCGEADEPLDRVNDVDLTNVTDG